MKTLNFFAEDNRLAKLSKLGDQLEKLNCVMEWKNFEPLLKSVFAKEAKGAGGRPPYGCLSIPKRPVLFSPMFCPNRQMRFRRRAAAPMLSV